MMFFLAVAAGGLFAWVAVQNGFYTTWIMLFHVLLSVYVAIFLTPVVLVNVPATANTPYGCALTLVSVAVATLFIAYGICYAFLSGQMRVDFPKAFDGPAAGILGFLTGFLACSFLTFAVALSPIPQLDAIKSFGLDTAKQTANIGYVRWWCDRLNGMVGSSRTRLSGSEAIALLEQMGAPASQPFGQPAVPPGQPAPPPGQPTAPTGTAPVPPGPSPPPATPFGPGTASPAPPATPPAAPPGGPATPPVPQNS